MSGGGLDGGGMLGGGYGIGVRVILPHSLKPSLTILTICFTTLLEMDTLQSSLSCICCLTFDGALGGYLQK